MSAAFDARLGPHAEAPVKPHLHKPMDPRFALGILAVLALGLFYMAYSIRTDIKSPAAARPRFCRSSCLASRC